MKRKCASGTYEITFASWISENTVRRAYRNVHEADNRPLGLKSLPTFRFVNEHTEAGQTSKWAELTRLWNKQNPEDPYTDRSALRRAYTRGEERLASPWSNEV